MTGLGPVAWRPAPIRTDRRDAERRGVTSVRMPGRPNCRCGAGRAGGQQQGSLQALQAGAGDVEQCQGRGDVVRMVLGAGTLPHHNGGTEGVNDN